MFTGKFTVPAGEAIATGMPFPGPRSVFMNYSALVIFCAKVVAMVHTITASIKSFFIPVGFLD